MLVMIMQLRDKLLTLERDRNGNNDSRSSKITLQLEMANKELYEDAVAELRLANGRLFED
jgi:hypothetical protein